MLLSSILIMAGMAAASPADTLSAAAITADKGVVVSYTDTVSSVGNVIITDVLNKLPGVQTNDYGGLAALKNVSIRGLGAAHTAIYLDGVQVGNVMSGQGDLGMYSLYDMEAVVVDYAQNSLSFSTARPVFAHGNFSAKAAFKGGSFGTYLPYLSLGYRISDKVSFSVRGEGVFSKGDFKYGDNLRRENNDIRQYRAGIDFFGRMDRGQWHAKAFWGGADRGTPGALSWPATDRQKDNNAFVQGTFQKSFSDLYRLNLSGKASLDKIEYTSSWGDSRYRQAEAQLNSSHIFSVKEWWQLSLAASLRYDNLASTSYDASRLGVISALASSFRWKIFSASLAVEYDGFFDKARLSRHSFSPSADLRLTPFEGFDIVAFVRRADRVPTFNELYYAGYGNPDLKTEKAWLTDAGFRWKKAAGRAVTINVGADVFYNDLRDKITSAPTPEDPNIWLPYNIGRVRTLGTDATAAVSYSAGGWVLSARAKYSFTSARDRTEGSATFGDQIPYVPRHALTLSGDASWRNWGVEIVWNCRNGLKDAYAALPDWNTLDFSLRKSFNFRNFGPLTLSLTGRNVTSRRYFLVSDYPMPGVAIYGGLEIAF